MHQKDQNLRINASGNSFARSKQAAEYDKNLNVFIIAGCQ